MRTPRNKIEQKFIVERRKPGVELGEESGGGALAIEDVSGDGEERESATP